MRRALLVSIAIVAAACDEPPASTTPPPSTGPTCPAAHVETAAGQPSAATIAPRVQAVVTRDLDADACLVSVSAEAESMLVEASHAGETIRARLASSYGTPTETLVAHVAAHRLLHTLLDANVESALSNGRGVAIGFVDHAAVCRRATATDVHCVRAPSVVGFDSVSEPNVGHIVVRAESMTGGTEWDVAPADGTFGVRTAPLSPVRALGTPPPAPDRFARVRSAASAAVAAPPDDAAVAIAREMPPGAATVRLDSRVIGATRLYLLSRCEGMLAHCVSLVATRDGSTLRFSESFAADATRVDELTDALALAPGALGVRVLEEGFHERSASELFVLRADARLEVREVPLGHETERGETETITEGCYRALTIEGPSRVRLASTHGWSGSHSDARGWNVVASTTCATDSVLCLDATSGFGLCP